MREMKANLHNFQGFSMQHVNREANGVAHVCAREALNIEDDMLVFDVASAFLIDSVQSDLNPPIIE